VDNQVEQIKQKLNIVDVINRYLPLKKRGRNHIACCPFHGEKTPSFTVSEELQIYKCFGCGKSGDIFSFLQEFEKIDFPEALEELAALAGVKLIKSKNYSKKELTKKTLLEINKEIAKFYNYILLKHPLGKDALDYLTSRAITSETIKEFNLGYSPSNPNYILNYLQKKNFKINDLIATGTFGKSQYNSHLYDRFQDRLVFPLANSRAQILAFSGRILPSSKKQNLAKYINSPETEIYHKSFNLFGLHLSKSAIRDKNAVIVTEGEFDMISLYQAGIKNTVAIKGTAFTEEQLQLLRRFTDTLILALDSDFAGAAASRRSIELADDLDFDIKVLILDEKYKDPDEAIKSDLNYFKKQLDQAVPIWDFIINSQLKINDPDTIKGKKEILKTVLPFLTKIKNLVIRSDYLKKLADELGSTPQSITQESQKYQQSPTKTPIPSKKKGEENKSPSLTEKMEELLLQLILGAKSPSKLAKKLEQYLLLIDNSRLNTIIKELLKTNKKFNANEFQQQLPAEFRSIFQSLFLNNTLKEIDSYQRSREIRKIVNKLSDYNIKQKMNQLNHQIAQLEKNGSQQDLEKVEKEYNQLLQQLAKIQSTKN